MLAWIWKELIWKELNYTYVLTYVIQMYKEYCALTNAYQVNSMAITPDRHLLAAAGIEIDLY